jgi:multidrug efflux pump subunit AcrB
VINPTRDASRYIERDRERDHTHDGRGAAGEQPDDVPGDDAPGDDAGDDARPRGGWTAIPNWAIAHPIGTSMIMLIGAVMGALFLTRLRVDLLPQIVFPQVRASVVSEGVDPAILEQTVTRELEAGLAATENATKISSTTREGNASVLLEFDYAADIDAALADASSSLERVRSLLPEEADPPIIFKADPSEIPVVELAITSDALDLVKLRTFADRILTDRLATTPGVASVDAVGGRERELVVTLDPGRLRGLGLAAGDVVQAVAAANRDEPGGAVTTGRRDVLARTEARVRSVAELEDLPIPLPGSGARAAPPAAGAGPNGGASGGSGGGGGGSGGAGALAGGGGATGSDRGVVAYSSRPPSLVRAIGDVRSVRLGDLGTVADASDEQRLFARLNGRPAVKLSIQKQPTANTIEVVDAVQARLAELRRDGALPGNVEVRTVNDQSVYIRQAVQGVASSTLVGGVLAVAAIAVFLTSWRQTLVIVVALPLVVLLTLLMMGAGGLTLNLFSLGGLALGLGQAVDSAIVMLENVTRTLREGAGRRDGARADAAPGDAAEPLDADQAYALARQAAREVTGSIITGTGANLASVLPFLLVSGLAALLFRELILVITFATLAAVAVAVTLVPMLAARLVRRELAAQARARAGGAGAPRRFAALRDRAARVARWVRGRDERLAAWYARRLRWTLGHRAATVLVAAGLFAATLFVARGLGTEFVPEVDDGRVRVQVSFSPGVAVDRADASTQRVERIIGGVPGVATQFAVAGGAIYGRTAVENATRSTIDVQLVPPDRRELSTDEWIARLRQTVAREPVAGARVLVRKAGIRGLRTSNRDGNVEFIISGDSLSTLLDLGERAERVLRGVPGLNGVQAQPTGGRPEFRLQVDRARAAALGITAAEVGQTVRAALEGLQAGTFVDADEEYDLRVRMERRAFANAADLEALPLVARGGAPVSVGSVARVVEGTGPVEIEREQQRRVVRLTGDANGGDRSLGEVAADAEARLREALDLPEGYTLTAGGDIEQQRENQRQLLLVAAVAVFLVFAVIALQYEGLLNPLVILLTVPLALTGVVLALKVSGTPLSAPVLLGVILLAGIVVNNAIILIEYAEEGQRERGQRRDEAIVEAGQRRLRPILMTAVVALLGSLPLALGLEEGGELLRPLAIAFVGGLAVATLLTLVVIPNLYLLAHAGRERLAARFGRGTPSPDPAAPHAPLQTTP